MEGRPEYLHVIVKNPLLRREGSQTSLDKAYTLRVLSLFILTSALFLLWMAPVMYKTMFPLGLFKQFSVLDG